MHDFTNRVVMITGASGNLGSAVAQAYRTANARLVLVDRHQDLLRQTFPDLIDVPDCLLSTCGDLTDTGDVQAIVKEALDRFGQIDVFVHTVGGYRAV